MKMAEWLFYFLLNKYLHVTILFGIIKQITHGSDDDGTDYQTLKNKSSFPRVDNLYRHPHYYVLFIIILSNIKSMFWP